jgi:hypothetical protein
MTKKHIVCTLDINYNKEITDITLPVMSAYAKNIDADFVILSDRKFPNLPITHEKFQLYNLDADHITFLDVDAIINPNAPDFSKDYPNAITIAEWLDGSDFIPESPPGKSKFRVHSAFLSFSAANKFIVEPHENPLQYIPFISNKNPSWHIDEYVMTLNILKHGADIIDLKNGFNNIIAHYGNHLTIEEKVEFLKQNRTILNQQELIHYG